MDYGNLRGVMAALVTPLLADGAIDHAALSRLIRRACSAGINGLCPVGSTGEGPHLSPTQRLEVINRVLQEVGTTKPVIPGIACSDIDSARRQLDDYAKAGVLAAVVAPPFYFSLSRQAVEDFYVRLADCSALPILLYHIPQFSKAALPLESVLTLSSHPRIVGIKDSSRDFDFYQALAGAALKEFSVLTGTDTMLLASLMAGGDGSIAASANVAPEWSVKLLQAVRASDWPVARELQLNILSLVTACRKGSFPSGWKAALEIAGVCNRCTVAPTPPLSPEMFDELRSEMVRLRLVPAKASDEVMTGCN
jgi:4-hydroxy-tetrahydrodipicolinate synthase